MILSVQGKQMMWHGWSKPGGWLVGGSALPSPTFVQALYSNSACWAGCAWQVAACIYAEEAKVMKTRHARF